MLIVSFRTVFFAPGGVRYRPDPDGTRVPDVLEKVLPSSAQIIRREDNPAPPEPRHRRKVGKVGDARPPVDVLSEMAKVDPIDPIGEDTLKKKAGS